MGIVISYDEKLGVPNSEIELASGEHVFITLGREGLVIKLLPRPGSSERLLFRSDPATAAKICDGLVDIQPGMKTTPLQILTAVTINLPDATAVEDAFTAAAT